MLIRIWLRRLSGETAGAPRASAASPQTSATLPRRARPTRAPRHGAARTFGCRVVFHWGPSGPSLSVASPSAGPLANPPHDLKGRYHRAVGGLATRTPSASKTTPARGSRRPGAAMRGAPAASSASCERSGIGASAHDAATAAQTKHRPRHQPLRTQLAVCSGHATHRTGRSHLGGGGAVHDSRAAGDTSGSAAWKWRPQAVFARRPDLPGVAVNAKRRLARPLKRQFTAQRASHAAFLD